MVYRKKMNSLSNFRKRTVIKSIQMQKWIKHSDPDHTNILVTHYLLVIQVGVGTGFVLGCVIRYIQENEVKCDHMYQKPKQDYGITTVSNGFLAKDTEQQTTCKWNKNNCSYNLYKQYPLDENHLVAMRWIIHPEVSNRVHQQGELNWASQLKPSGQQISSIIMLRPESILKRQD